MDILNLSRFFKKAALVAMMGLAMTGCNNQTTPPPEQQDQSQTLPQAQPEVQNRAANGSYTMTAGEQRLIHDIFGNAVNTGKLHLIFKTESRPDRGAEYQYSNITFFQGDTSRSQDYSREDDTYKFNLFVHEVTHAWQDQAGTGKWNCDRDAIAGNGKYDYPLDARYRFSDYCSEQQAAIVGDYAARFLHPSHATTRFYVSPRGFTADDTAASDTQLQKLVEDAFPQARTARMNFGQRNTAVAGVVQQQVRVPKAA